MITCKECGYDMTKMVKEGGNITAKDKEGNTVYICWACAMDLIDKEKEHANR